ncbi:hypothetical protein J1N35_008529 [Gossypium stocksii]|uniref:Uncharacterized protein n=1 Tax=Gossypium stocksii TaxID=47602 RepID=A0A9D3W996_9ROSI|nr:hypothetical protein J1N35_008529 [Gossypium stocksii]
MRVLSIKYRFCASTNPVTYDSFDIKGARSLEVMVQTHLTSGSPHLELYVEFSSQNEALATSTSTAGMTSTSNGWQSTSDWGHYEKSTKKDDVLPMTSIDEGISYVADVGGLDDESDVDPPRELGFDGVEVVLFSKSELAQTELEDDE